VPGVRAGKLRAWQGAVALAATDRAPVYPRVLDELIPSALRTTERHASKFRGD
jgi:hypothetical protein